LIIVGPEGPTIGGYPVVGVVCSADLDRVGQLVPGQIVDFQPITLDEARALLAERRSAIDTRKAMLSLAVTGHSSSPDSA
jgi:allophanate hydrolase subunit 2